MPNAASIRKVSSSLSRGKNHLPSAAAPKPKTPKPTPAINSGKKFGAPGPSTGVSQVVPSGKSKSKA